MTQKLLQINFKFTTSAKEYTTMVAPLVDSIAKVSGLEWKVWLINEQNREAGGIYLFRDEASAQGYVNGEIVATMKKQPTLKDITVKFFDVEETLTHKTRGPIKSLVAA